MPKTNIKHGTPEWYRARLGIPTSSRYEDVCSLDISKKGFGTKAMSYAYLLVAERLIGESHQVTSKAMEHGKEWEPVALKEYTKRTGIEIESGIWYDSLNGKTGGTPDAVTLDGRGCVEVKCPYNPASFVEQTITPLKRLYKFQIAGQLLLTGAAWCDFVLFLPGVMADPVNREHAMKIKRYSREDLAAEIALIQERLPLFIQLVDDIEKEFRKV